MVERKSSEPKASGDQNLGSPERPWGVSSEAMAKALPDGAWYVVAPDGSTANAKPRRKMS